MSDSALSLPGGEDRHEPFLQHHFTDAEQQFDAGKIGMWLFLVTELLLFGGLFVAYGILQSMHPEAFIEAHHHLDRTLGAVNTIVLLLSSFTMVMAVWAAQTDKRRALIAYLTATLGFSAVFLVIKYVEYAHKFHDGLLPGTFYAFEGGVAANQHIFFSFYFMMTGLHGVHIVAGMAVIGWVLWRSVRGDFSSRYFTPVDLVGLYWHLVDLIWIYLFPLLYLVG